MESGCITTPAQKERLCESFFKRTPNSKWVNSLHSYNQVFCRLNTVLYIVVVAVEALLALFVTQSGVEYLCFGVLYIVINLIFNRFYSEV